MRVTLQNYICYACTNIYTIYALTYGFSRCNRKSVGGLLQTAVYMARSGVGIFLDALWVLRGILLHRSRTPSDRGLDSLGHCLSKQIRIQWRSRTDPNLIYDL